MSSEPRTLKTTRMSFRIIELIKEMEGARVSELADRLDSTPSTVHGYLATLLEDEYLVQEGDTYDLGLQFLNLGRYAQNRQPFYSSAKRKVEQLADESQGRAHFIVEEHGRGVYLHTASGKHAVETYSQVGRQAHLHTTAAGKAILAHLPGSRVDEIIEGIGLPQRTENTITDRETLMEELETIREERIAYNFEEQLPGVHAVGAPVLDSHGTVVGAFSVSGPVHRLSGELIETEIPTMVLGTANEFELEIEYS